MYKNNEARKTGEKITIKYIPSAKNLYECRDTNCMEITENFNEKLYELVAEQDRVDGLTKKNIKKITDKYDKLIKEAKANNDQPKTEKLFNQRFDEIHKYYQKFTKNLDIIRKQYLKLSDDLNKCVRQKCKKEYDKVHKEEIKMLGDEKKAMKYVNDINKANAKSMKKPKKTNKVKKVTHRNKKTKKALKATKMSKTKKSPREKR